ncbi:hypothetical protein pb186bvf_013677 [Paramecium bursaria]
MASISQEYLIILTNNYLKLLVFTQFQSPPLKNRSILFRYAKQQQYNTIIEKEFMSCKLFTRNSSYHARTILYSHQTSIQFILIFETEDIIFSLVLFIKENMKSLKTHFMGYSIISGQHFYIERFGYYIEIY